jgi:hypothetical protein
MRSAFTCFLFNVLGRVSNAARDAKELRGGRKSRVPSPLHDLPACIGAIAHAMPDRALPIIFLGTNPVDAKRQLHRAAATAAVLLLACTSASAATFRMTVSPARTTSATTPPLGVATGGAQPNEIDSAVFGDEASGSDGEDTALDTGGKVINRSIARGVGHAKKVRSNAQASSNPGIVRSFHGLDFYQQRFANGGNQFSVEPPDQGLCAGNGFVMETVNDVIKIYDTAGNAKIGPLDLNTFYGYAAAINRTTGARGPEITDPSCLFDADTQRWFHLVLTLDRVGTTAALAGTNHLDLAISSTADPTGTWTVYKLPVQNDGTQGTPDHGCDQGFCLGDYPHIGADAHGIFITTNEFSLFGSGFYGAQIYAISKQLLASQASDIPVVLINTGDPDIPVPGFTVWPAQSVGSNHNAANGGTEFLLSSLAVFFDSGESNQLVQWTIANTQSLGTPNPAISLATAVISTQDYSVPPPSSQKPGNLPLRDCLADRKTKCFSAIAGATKAFSNTLAPIDSNDSRMQQVYYANGKLWGALDTGVQIDGDVDANGQPIVRAGLAYFVLNPGAAKVINQGVVGLKANNLSYPAIAVLDNGRGVMGFTLVGDDHWPSAAYVSLDATSGAGDIHVIAEGKGPQDGFSGYFPLSNPPRPRWGDYGAAVTDGSTIWLASEYIGQTCTYTQYKADPTCGKTRGALGNWGTRITQIGF